MNLRSLSLVIPTLLRIFFWTIQADQSRRCVEIWEIYDEEFRFNRINSGRSIPTIDIMARGKESGMFQSYQFRQINPDEEFNQEEEYYYVSRFQSYQFRQINPDTRTWTNGNKYNELFQSYQFRQINPDVVIQHVDGTFETVSIVSIQADQSRRFHWGRGVL